jgi:hypothetical protein
LKSFRVRLLDIGDVVEKNPRIEENAFAILLEYDADNYSARTFAARIASGARPGVEKQFDLSDETWIAAHIYTRYFVSWTSLICDVLGGGSTGAEMDTEEFADHPPSEFRMFMTIPSYVSVLLDDMGVSSGIVTRSLAVTDTTLLSLSQTYEALSLLVSGLSPTMSRRVMSQIAKKSEEYEFQALMAPFRYRVAAATGEDRPLGQLNNVTVPPPLLGRVLEFVLANPEALYSELERYRMAAAYISTNELDEEFGYLLPAVIYRLDGLVKAVSGSWWSLLEPNPLIDGPPLVQHHLLDVAAAMPLVRSEGDLIGFDNDLFQALASQYPRG